MTDAEVRQPVPAWIVGGGLLVASAVLPLVLAPPVFAPLALAIVHGVGSLLFAAAMIVFALGARGRGSVVGRRPLGVGALFVLGLLPPLLGLASPAGFSAADTGALQATQVIATVQFVVWVGAALVAVVEIARARVLPQPWRWAPAWGLALVVALFALTQILAVAVTAGPNAEDLVVVLAVAGTAAGTLVPLALGVLGMTLGAWGLAVAPTQVYPPAR